MAFGLFNGGINKIKSVLKITDKITVNTRAEAKDMKSKQFRGQKQNVLTRMNIGLAVDKEGELNIGMTAAALASLPSEVRGEIGTETVKETELVGDLQIEAGKETEFVNPELVALLADIADKVGIENLEKILAFNRGKPDAEGVDEDDTTTTTDTDTDT